MNLDFIARWITAACTVAIALVAILAVFTGKLPTAARIREIIREENAKTAREREKHVQESIRESTEKIIQTIVSFQEMPAEVRNRVYREALMQAEDKGYIYEVAGNYLTSQVWVDEDRRLLTQVERWQINGAVVESSEQDQLSLMYSVLSDDDIIKRLTFDIQIGSKVAHLTPYDKIGIIGGYIGEIKLESGFKR